MKAGKHPQITQITQIFLRGFYEKRKGKEKIFMWIDGVDRV